MALSTYAAPKGVSRRGFLRGTAAATGAMLLPGGAFAGSKDGLLVWLPGGSDVFCKLHTELMNSYGARNGLGESKLMCGLGQDTEYSQAMIAAIAAGSPPDVALTWDSPVSLGSQGAFVALDEMMAKSKISIDTWPAGLLSSCQFKGATYGLPVTAGLYSMWYNQDLFDAKGIPSDRASFPKTWVELRKMSKEFTQWDGDTLKMAGFLPPRQPETYQIWSALNGGTLFDAANLKYTIDAEQNIEMFHFFLDWINEEYKGDLNLVDRSGATISGYPDDALGTAPMFQAGRLAGFQSGSWLLGDLYGAFPPTFTRWNLAPHPVGPSGTTSVSGTWPNWFVVPVGSKDPQAGFDYLTFMATEGVLTWFAAVPDIPTNSLVTLTSPASLVERRGEEFAKDAMAFFAEQAKVVTPMWNSPSQSFGNDQISLAMGKIFTKAATVEEALADAQAASQAELDRVLAG